MSTERLETSPILRTLCLRWIVALLLSIASVESYAIAVTAAIGQSDIYVRETTSYFITVGPVGLNPETASLSYALPSGAQYNSSSASQGTCSFDPAGGTGAGVLRCNIGVIPAGQSVSISVTVQLNAIGDNVSVFDVAASLRFFTGSGTILVPDPGSASAVTRVHDLPVVSLATRGGDASEPQTNGEFALTLNEPVLPGYDNIFSVGLRVLPSSTATELADFSAVPQIIDIPYQQTAVPIPVIVIDDALVEGNETLSVQLVKVQSGIQYHLGNNSSASLNILDNDLPPPTISLRVTDGDAGEPGNVGVLEVVSDQPAGSNGLTVLYSIAGSAKAGTDYTALNGTVQIPPGKSNASIVVTPIDNTIYNGPTARTVDLKLAQNATNAYNIGTNATGTVVIKDDETPPLPVAALIVSDGDAGEPNNPGQFQIKLDTAPGGNGVTVTYNVSGSSVADKDYKKLTGSVSFGPQVTSANIDVAIIDDLIYNGPNPRVVSVTLGAGTGYDIGAANNGSITIKDNETPPLPVATLAITDGDVAEPSNNGTLTVNLDQVAPTSGLVVQYKLTGTSVAGKDYSTLSGQITVPANSRSANITIAPIDDSIYNGPTPRTVTVTLIDIATARTYNLGTPSDASITIKDNETPPLPIATLIVSDGDAGEPNNAGQFQIKLDTAPGGNGLTINYAVGGSAVAGKDYPALSGSVTFGPQATSANIDVNPIDDQTYNGTNPRNVAITISSGNGYNIGNAANGSIAIKDNEAPPLPVATLVVSDGDAGEPSNTGQFQIKLDTAPGGNGLTINYTVGGSAVAGKDYQSLSGTVTFGPQSTSVNIDINPIDDQIYNGENSRIVSATLATGTGYNLGTASNGSITIKDNETPPLPVATLVITDGIVGEPNNGGMLTVNLDQPAPANGLVVRYVVSGTAVANKDYAALPGQITVPANSRSVAITIAPMDDSIYNGTAPRTVTVALVDITSARTYSVGKPSDATVTMSDNEAPPLPVATLLVSDGDAGEPNNGGQFQIKLDSAPGGNGLTVTYNMSGSAVADKDYKKLTGSIFFGPQVTSTNIDVAIIDDLIYNGVNPRSVAVTLASGASYNVGSANSGSITIKDNETPPLPVATLVVSDGDAGEPSNAGQFQIKLDSAPGRNGLTVNYNISGSAVAGKDYQALSGTVTLAPQATSANIDLIPIDDQIYNGTTPRNVVLTLAGGTSYNVGNASNGSITINDNEAPPLPVATLVVSDGDAGEPNNAGQFQIKLDAAPGGNGTTINYTISGSAVASKDYQSLSGTVAFGPQTTAANIDITVIDDQIYNGATTRVVSVTLTNGTGYNIGSANTASLNIKDNETAPIPVASITASDADTGEPSNTGAFSVTLDHPAGPNGLAVRYTVGGNAVADQTYTAVTGTVTIPADSNNAIITVIPIDDEIYNGADARNVVVTLVATPTDGGAAYTVGEANAATITIKDNEAAPLPPVVSVRTVDPNATAGGSSGAFAIVLDKPAPTNGLTVDYTVSGSALADQDYVALPGKAEFAAGATQAIVLVTPIANTATTNSKSVQLTLTPNETYHVASEAPAMITISHDVTNTDSTNMPGAPIVGSNPLTIERVVGELQQTSRVGTDVPFTVRVIDSSGLALPAVTIAWSLDTNGIDAGGTILGATTTSDSNGAASATLHTGPMAANYALTARASTTINNQAASASETFVVTAGLIKIVSPDTPESAIAQAFDQLCPALNSNTNRTAIQNRLLDRCTVLYDALANSSDAEVLQALRALAPEELSAQGTLAHEVMRTQIDNIAERLRALRRGSRQLSLGSLSLNIDDQNVPGSVLETITKRAIGAAAGDEGQDSIWRDERLGVFVSGEINHGRRSQTERESDFSFDTRGITFGVDYRISNAVVVGGALGYAGTDVTLGSSGGNLDAKGQILSLYSSWQVDNRWSLDGILSYGTQDYSTQRVIDYTIGGNRTLLSADGDNSSANIALSASLNYALTAQSDDAETPSGISSELFARLDHTRSHIDGYSESGANELNLQIDQQQVQTWHLAFGVDWSKAISRGWGIITPQASVSWEFDGSDTYNINGYFVSDPNATTWSLTTDTPDRGYFRANAGISALYSNGWSWFAQYETQLQRDNFSNHGWHGGLRFSRRF